MFLTDSYLYTAEEPFQGHQAAFLVAFQVASSVVARDAAAEAVEDIVATVVLVVVVAVLAEWRLNWEFGHFSEVLPSSRGQSGGIRMWTPSE